MDWNKIWTFLSETAVDFGMKLLAALIVFAVGIKLIGVLKKWMLRSKKLEKLDKSLRAFLISFMKIGLYAVLFITVAMILGVPATSFITILASCGVAIGLALQGSLSNFAGGLMILFFKPFKIGDFIEAGGESGVVQDISVVYTILLTGDNKRVTIPNGTLTNSVMKNYTAEKTRRLDLAFETAYDSDPEKVKKLIWDTAEKHALALKDPEMFVRLSFCGASAMVYTLRVWCKTEDYWTLHFDLTEQVKKAFDANGIEVPYQQLDIHVKEK